MSVQRPIDTLRTMDGITCGAQPVIHWAAEVCLYEISDYEVRGVETGLWRSEVGEGI